MSADVLVLGYHAVSETWPWRFSVAPSALRAHLRHVRSRGYRSVTFTEALRVRSGRVVAVTFDDGFRSVAEVAAPILKEEGFQGTVFAVTDQVGCAPMRWEGLEGWLGTEHERELDGASWHDLQELSRAGWEIGSHTRTHPALTDLPAQDLARELEGSRAAVEAALDVACTSLAYPYGAVDERVVSAAGAAGYAAAACFPPRFPRPRALDWPRVGVYRDSTALRFAVEVASPVRILRSSRLRPPLVEASRRFRR